MSDTTMAMQTVTAFFDERVPAQKAIDDLVAAGIPSDAIRLAEGTGTTAVAEAAKPTASKSFWDELKDLFLPDQDRHGYAEGLSRGGYLLSVRVATGDLDRVQDILDSEGAVDMDSREAEWKATGWNGVPVAASSVAAPSAMGEAELMDAVEAPQSLLRDKNNQRSRLRSYTVQNDLASGFPTDRNETL